MANGGSEQQFKRLLTSRPSVASGKVSTALCGRLNRIFIALNDIVIFACDLAADSGFQRLFNADKYIAASPEGHFICCVAR